ncbi:Ger(x)C family spore germination protein [Salipaludibacillus sp. HK11]|uniref:Ger(x)C family spore germination protein n=1 Tax=Salipaludibacillus sp. HK11 TaxID=3394320 RepID=UPI0039FC52B1
MRKSKALFSLLLVILTGCLADSKEIDHRTMVVGMGIDIVDDNTYSVSVQAPVIIAGGAEGEAGFEKEFETLQATGPSPWEAVANIEANTPTVLFFGHLKMVAIGQALAERGIDKISDLFDRGPAMDNKVLLLIVDNDINVYDFISRDSRLISLPSLYVDRFFMADQKLARTKEVKLFEYRKDRNMISNAATVPVGYLDNELLIENLAVLQNGKMVGKLEGKEAGISQLLKNKELNNMNYSLISTNENDIIISLRVDLSMDFSYEKTNPVEIHLNVEGSGEIVHIPERKLESNLENITKIEKELERRVKEDIEHTISKMKLINTEPWLMGHRIWARDHRYFDQLNWEEDGWIESKIYATVNIEVDQTGQKGVMEKIKVGR